MATLTFWDDVPPGSLLLGGLVIFFAVVALVAYRLARREDAP